MPIYIRVRRVSDSPYKISVNLARNPLTYSTYNVKKTDLSFSGQEDQVSDIVQQESQNA